ncbi:uncharacterized protein LOC141906238 [Tubulanus polymorphus]|uniref:uncharacterized protein LOC141906238 n=1 Tax=Tubulanus polymorphus TaxID=672921 RepID=UPI003DA278A5
MAENSATEKSGVGVKLSRAGRSANRRVANALTSACDTAIREHDLLKASINFNNLKRKFSQLEMIDAHLLDEIQSDNEIEQFILEAEDYLNNLNGSIFKFNREIGKVSSLEKQSPVRSTEIKTALLPKLQLPKYNGNLKEWPTFWGLFETSVHLNSQFSEIEKFSYLKCLLIGDARSCIDGLPLTNDNYSAAVSLLKTRFGQNHKISQAYLSALVDLSPPNNERSSLRKFYDECNYHMRQLNALGTSHDNHGAIFELEIIESTVSLDVKDVSNCTITEPTSTVSQLFLSTGAQNSKKKCVFCEGDKHHAGNCKSKYSCRMCKKRHHTSICFQTRKTRPYSVPNSRGVNFSVEEGQNRGIGNEQNRIKSNMTNSVTTQSSSVPIFETESLIQSDDHIETQTASQNISLCNSFGNVLLKTAVVNIENPYSGSIVSCNTLFDDGSQRSFMTAKMASQLGLKSSRTETLDLGAFGSQNSKVRTLDVVKICIECENSYLIEVSVLVVPMITRPLDMGGFLEIPEFKDLNLANPIHSRVTKSTLKKLSKTPEILKIYSEIIDEQLKRDYIEIVPVDDYIHHRDDFGSPSLNDSLEPGPALQNDLTGLNWSIEQDIITFKEKVILDEFSGKILTQTLWRESYDWDTAVPQKFGLQWQRIVSDLNYAIRNMHVPRWYGFDTNLPVKLHVFVDAGQPAYGAVAYLDQGGKIQFILSRGRVAPLKQVTIPRLELMAAIVLSWLRSDKKLPEFVANRIRAIKSICDFDKWKFCNGDRNPADLLTRGVSAQCLFSNGQWLCGPIDIADRINQIPIIHINTSTCVQYVSIEKSEPVGISKVVDADGFSSLTKLFRMTTLVLRFINNCKVKVSDRNFDSISADDLNNSEKVWLLCIQRSEYPLVFARLSGDKSFRAPVVDRLINDLQLFIGNDGLIHSNGRLENADLDDLAKRPILLPKYHQYVNLVIRRSHFRIMHQGVNATVADIRCKYWIPSIRQRVKDLLKSCCPLVIKGSGGETSKCHVCLFTCAVSRAVHLELVRDLTPDCFLLALRRFAGRRDVSDLEALTPSMLMFGHRITGLPQPSVRDYELNYPNFCVTRELLTRGMKYISLLLSEYKRRWKGEYLLNLCEYQKCKGVDTELVKKGSVVQIHDDGPRLKWRLGVITELHRGKDGKVRNVSLKTARGHTNRALPKLYPLEVYASTDFASVSKYSATKTAGEANVRPKRAAAVAAEEKITAIAAAEQSDNLY